MSSSARPLLSRDIRPIELALEGHALRPGVRTVAGLGDGVAARDHVHDATAVDQDAAARATFCRPVEAEHVLGQAIESFDGHPGLRRAWIVLGAEDDVDVRALAEPDRLSGDVLREAALTEGEEKLRDIAFDPRERDLGLRIAEARVVLEHLPAVRGLDETRVQDAAKGRFTLGKCFRNGGDDLLSEGLRLVVR